MTYRHIWFIISYFILFYELSFCRSKHFSRSGCLCYTVSTAKLKENEYRVFDGVGAISGGGATSKLLVNYEPKLRDQILDYLFKPNFGASLHILKVEIGGDGQSTDGTEASLQHTQQGKHGGDTHYRGYEWWLMNEAKKRNPNIRLYGLPWSFPGWLGKTPYENIDLVTNYIIKWIMSMKTFYFLTIDYVGIWNEKPYNISYIKMLRQKLDANSLKHVKIVASDNKWEIADDIVKNPALAQSVDIIGAHYPGTFTSSNSLRSRKPLWSSEDYSTFNDDVGAGCWARILNQNYVNGNMTSTIAWNLVASYYKGLPYYGDGLMTADEPWSGHYIVNNPIWITAHTTQFAFPGWIYLNHGEGAGHLEFGGSYVSLTNPKMSDLTIIIETMTRNKSICIRPYLPPFDVKPQTATFMLHNSFKKISSLYVWYTNLSNGTIFTKLTPIQVIDSKFTLKLGLNEIYTLTTLKVGNKGEYPPSPKSRPFPLPYIDTLQQYHSGDEPYNLAPQLGSFETVMTETGERFMRQTVVDQPIKWCNVHSPHKVLGYSIIGDHFWVNISISIEVHLFNSAKSSPGAFVGVRSTTGGCHSDRTRGLFLFIFPRIEDKIVFISTDLYGENKLAENTYTFTKTWTKIEIAVKGDLVVGKIDNKVVLKTHAPSNPKHGFAALGTSTTGYADFKNLIINSTNV